MAKTYSLGGIGLPIRAQHELIRRIWLKIVKKECFWLQEQWRMITLLTGSESVQLIFFDKIWVNGMNFSSQKIGLTQVTPKETVGIFLRKWAANRDHDFKFKTLSAHQSRRGFFWKLKFYKILYIINYYCTNFQRNKMYTVWVIDNETCINI